MSRSWSLARSRCGITTGCLSTSIFRRSSARRWLTTCSAGQSFLPASGAGTRSCRSSSAPPPTASDTAWCTRPTAPTSPAEPATARAPPPTLSSRSSLTQTSRTSARPVSHDRADLLGGFPAPRRSSGWQTFFDLGDGQVKNNKRIDTTISSVLFTLPLPAIAPHTQTSPVVLPQRNLLRQLTWGLPSGQRVAAAMGLPALGPSDLTDIASVYPPLGRSTPLWYYILAEAKVTTNGLNLGPVGGRIVAETLIGLLRADPTSYLNIYPRFHSVPGHRWSPRPHTQPQHHRQQQLHQGPLPPLRRRPDPRNLPVTARPLSPAFDLRAGGGTCLVLYDAPSRDAARRGACEAGALGSDMGGGPASFTSGAYPR